jgi:hypothetical protein
MMMMFTLKDTQLYSQKNISKKSQHIKIIKDSLGYSSVKNFVKVCNAVRNSRIILEALSSSD